MKPETHAKILAAWTPERRAEARRVALARWADPDRRAQAKTRGKARAEAARASGRIGAQKVMADPELLARKSAGLQRAWADPERLERARKKGRETWARTAFARALAALVDGVTSAQVETLGQLIDHALTLGALSEAAATEIAGRLGARSP